MNKKVKEFLEKIGMSDEFVTALSSKEEAELDKINVQEIVDSVNENYKKILSADPAFVEGFKKAARGEVLSSKENKFMKLTGVTKEEYDALPQATKFDSLIDLGLKKLKESAGQGDEAKDKLIRELNEKLALKDTEIEKIRTEEIPTIEKGYQAKENEFHYRNLLRKSLSKISDDDNFDLVIKADGAIPAIDLAIKNKFGYKLNDSKDSITLLKKGTDLEEFENNKPIDFVKAVRKVAKELGFVKESNAGAGGGKKEGGGDPAGDGDKKEKNFGLPGLKKAAEHAKSFDKTDDK